MQGATLDSVIINVESEASKASDGITRLTRQLQTLRESVKGGFNNLTKLAKSLNELKPASEGLATVASNLKELESVTTNLKQLSEIETPSGLTNTITRLKELAEVSGSLEKTASGVSNITKMVEPLSSLATIQKPLGLGNLVRYLTDLSSLGGLDNIISEVSKLPQIVEPLQSLGSITSGRGMGTVIDNLEKLPEVMSKLGDTTTLENIGRVARELVTHLEPLSQEMQRIANGYSAISKMSDTYGVSAQTVTRYTKQQTSVFKILRNVISGIVGVFKNLKQSGSDTATSVIKHFQKMNSKIKQVGLSLIGTRSLFTMLRKAVSEYTAMDTELQKFTQNVWRAFGAQLAPVIEYAMYLFKQFVRVIYSVVLALTGVDLISRANQKAMAGWGKAAKDTLGNLQKFDDLNVVEFPKDSGGGGDNSLIDLQTIDLTPFQKIIDWVKELKEKIKEALDTGRWYEVGRVFADGINAGVDFLLSKIPIILEEIMVIGIKLGDFLNGVIENVNWSNIGNLMSEGLKVVPVFLSGLFGTINWTTLGNSLNDFFAGFDLIGLISAITNAFIRAFNGIFTILTTLDWGMIAKKVGDAIVAILSDMSYILSKVPWEELGNNIRIAITNIPWSDIWKGIAAIATEAFKGFAEFIGGIFNINGDNLYKLKDAIIAIGTAFITYKLVDSVGKLATNIINFGKQITNIKKVGKIFSDIGSSITNISTPLKVLGENPLLTGEISNLTHLETINGSLIGISGSLGNIVSLFGGLLPFIGIITGIVTVVLAAVEAFKQLYQQNENFRNTVNELGTMIKGTFSKVLEGLKEVVDILWTAIKDFYETTLKPLFQFLVDLLKPFVEFFINLLSVLWKNVIDPLASFIMTGLKLAFTIFGEAIKTITTLLSPLIDVLKWLWKNILEPIVSFILNKVISSIEKVTSKIKSSIDLVTNIFNSMKDTIKFVFDTIRDTVTNIWKGIWSNMKGVLNNILGGVQTFLNSIVRGINGLSKGLRTIGNKVFEIIGVDVTFNPISELSIPKLETGTNEIETEGIYHLHPGEAVIPKQYNPALGGGTNTETNERLDRLISLINDIEFTNIVNLGNEQLYKRQQTFNKFQQNKYGTTDLY